jgi:hypothetical protein
VRPRYQQSVAVPSMKYSRSGSDGGQDRISITCDHSRSLGPHFFTLMDVAWRVRRPELRDPQQVQNLKQARHFAVSTTHVGPRDHIIRATPGLRCLWNGVERDGTQLLRTGTSMWAGGTSVLIEPVNQFTSVYGFRPPARVVCDHPQPGGRERRALVLWLPTSSSPSPEPLRYHALPLTLSRTKALPNNRQSGYTARCLTRLHIS